MGPKTVQNGNFQKWSSTLGEGQTDLFGPFWACGDPFPAVFDRFSLYRPPEASPGGSPLHGPGAPRMAPNHPKRARGPRIRWVP